MDEKLTSPGGRGASGFLFLAAAIILTRLPSLFFGYGSDGDGWRVAWSAVTLWKEGVYQPSRFPGFPVYEILNTPLVGLGGSVLSNAATLVVFLVCAYLFRSILLKMGIPSAHLLAWIFSFIPMLWKNSAVTMDYVWGLCFILFALLAALEGKFLLAAAMTGLAAGTRLTHVVLLLPLLAFEEEGKRLRRFLAMAGVAAIITLICYLPFLLRAGLLHDVARYIADMRKPSILTRCEIFLYRATYAIGLPSAVGIPILLLLSRKKAREALRLRDSRVAASVLAMVLLLMVFFSLPDEREYLIPTLPFLLILLGLALPRTSLAVAGVLFVSYAFINVDLIAHGIGRQHVSPGISAGFLVNDYRVRKAYEASREILGAYPLEDSTIVVTGWGPIFWFQNPYLVHTRELERMFGDEDVAASRAKPHCYYVYSLPYETYRSFRSRGFRVMYLEGVKDYIASFLHYDLDTAGMSPLRIPMP